MLTAWIAGISGFGFIWRTLTYETPFLDLRALKDPNFALGSFFSFITGLGIFTTIYLTPLFLGRVRGYSALQTGEAILSTGIFQMLAIPFYTLLAKRIDLRWLMMFGLACFTLGLWEFTALTHDWSWRELLLPQGLRGFAQQFTVAPIVTLTLGSLPPSRLKSAAGLFNLMRNLGGAIGIAACGTILNDRTNLHFFRLAEHLNGTNASMNALLLNVTTHFAAVNGGDMGQAHAAALKRLWWLTFREAQVQTFADAFLVITILLGITTLMVPFLRNVPPAPIPSPDAH